MNLSSEFFFEFEVDSYIKFEARFVENSSSRSYPAREKLDSF